MTEELSGLANDWAAAELDGDTASLKEILADDFVGVGPRGFVLTGERWIDRRETGNLKHGTFGLDEAEVRAYGDAAIVVVCRQTAAGIYADENGRYDVDERFRATLVFVRQDGGWRLAGLQVSPLLGREPATRTTPPKQIPCGRIERTDGTVARKAAPTGVAEKPRGAFASLDRHV